jgi:hypothetical protein
MGCSWKTVNGKRIRTAPVSSPRSAVGILSTSVVSFLIKLGISFVHASPALTIEELRDATITLWHDPELGYFVQAKMTPSSTSIYHAITTAEATALEAGRPAQDFIARMFHPVKIEDTLN